jgi:glycosyltransferase involved in cell wall biosynthesis
VQRPELSVVVASHDRPLRLRWLLNALEAQTLRRDLWEVVVGHDSAGPETDALLAEHPLARQGRLRSTRLAPGTAPPGANRNAALRLARAPTIVFTDDDCRPPDDWLAAVRAAVAAHPGAVIQGPVEPDPDEGVMLRSPFPRTQSFADVPRPWAECCNIVYPTSLLDALGGFDPHMHTGEDAELAARARATGVAIAGDERMLTYHAVDEGGLIDALRGTVRWGDLAELIRRHPELRRHLFAGVFWKRPHALLLAGVAALALRRRAPAALLLTAWAGERNAHGPGVRGRARQLASLPGWLLIDSAEIAVLARASATRGTLVL